MVLFPALAVVFLQQSILYCKNFFVKNLLLCKLEETTAKTLITCCIKPCQVFQLELPGVQLRLVSVWGEKGAVGELVAVPVGSRRPDLSVSKDEGQGLSHHLIFREGLIGHSLSRVHLFRIGYLKTKGKYIIKTPNSE